MTEQDKIPTDPELKKAMFNMGAKVITKSLEMDKILELREDTAKYMGDSNFIRFRTHSNNVEDHIICQRVNTVRPDIWDVWKPDQNSEQADMVEDKLEGSVFILQGLWHNGEFEGYSYELEAVIKEEGELESIGRVIHKDKKLARALALWKAIKV